MVEALQQLSSSSTVLTATTGFTLCQQNSSVTIAITTMPFLKTRIIRVAQRRVMLAYQDSTGLVAILKIA